jgi:uncharacterized protein YciI
MMKTKILLCILFFTNLAHASQTLPLFLQGTWKMENREIYEHWDVMNDNKMQGFSYEMNRGQMTVIEYLSIEKSGKKIQLTATVRGENEGKPISFRMTRGDSIFFYENPKHDFPKKLIYHLKSPTEIFVEISDGAKTVISYSMFRQDPAFADTLEGLDFDPVLAEKLGADDYGMKGYMLVILKTGANTGASKAFNDSCFRGHMENISRLVDEGTLVLAGPLGKNEKSYRGIFILNTRSPEEAESILQTDPAINGNLLGYEMYPWYGSAALPLYIESAKKIAKKKP